MYLLKNLSTATRDEVSRLSAAAQNELHSLFSVHVDANIKASLPLAIGTFVAGAIVGALAVALV